MLRPLADVLAGAGYLRRGVTIVFGSSRLLVIGALPAVVTTLLLLAGLVALVVSAGDLAAWATPFADDWSGGLCSLLRVALRIALGVAVVGAGFMVAVLVFAALTLAVGAPFYERIAAAVDESLGGVERTDRPGRAWWRRLGSGVRDSVLLLAVSLGCGLALFALGFVPVVGPVIVAVLAACVGGWLLTLELTGVAFDARGIALSDRRRMLRASRARTLGFAVPTYLLCLVPLVAIVVMPVAVAGATLLARDALGQARTASQRAGSQRAGSQRAESDRL